MPSGIVTFEAGFNIFIILLGIVVAFAFLAGGGFTDHSAAGGVSKITVIGTFDTFGAVGVLDISGNTFLDGDNTLIVLGAGGGVVSRGGVTGGAGSFGGVVGVHESGEAGITFLDAVFFVFGSTGTAGAAR